MPQYTQKLEIAFTAQELEKLVVQACELPTGTVGAPSVAFEFSVITSPSGTTVHQITGCCVRVDVRPDKDVAIEPVKKKSAG